MDLKGTDSFKHVKFQVKLQTLVVNILYASSALRYKIFKDTKCNNIQIMFLPNWSVIHYKLTCHQSFTTNWSVIHYKLISHSLLTDQSFTTNWSVIHYKLMSHSPQTDQLFTTKLISHSLLNSHSLQTDQSFTTDQLFTTNWSVIHCTDHSFTTNWSFIHYKLISHSLHFKIFSYRVCSNCNFGWLINYCLTSISISSIFRTRKGSIIYNHYNIMIHPFPHSFLYNLYRNEWGKGWVNQINDFWLPLKMYGELGNKQHILL